MYSKILGLAVAFLSFGVEAASFEEKLIELPLTQLSKFREKNTLIITLMDGYEPTKDRLSYLDTYGLPNGDSSRYRSSKMEDRLRDHLACSVSQGLTGGERVPLPPGTKLEVTRVIFHMNWTEAMTPDGTPIPTPRGIILQTEGNLFDVSCDSFRTGEVSTLEGPKLAFTGIHGFTVGDLVEAFTYSQSEPRENNRHLVRSLVSVSANAKEGEVSSIQKNLEESQIRLEGAKARKIIATTKKSKGFFLKRLFRLRQNKN